MGRMMLAICIGYEGVLFVMWCLASAGHVPFPDAVGRHLRHGPR
jgi:hypothetical protein